MVHMENILHASLVSECRVHTNQDHTRGRARSFCLLGLFHEAGGSSAKKGMWVLRIDSCFQTRVQVFPPRPLLQRLQPTARLIPCPSQQRGPKLGLPLNSGQRSNFSAFQEIPVSSLLPWSQATVLKASPEHLFQGQPMTSEFSKLCFHYYYYFIVFLGGGRQSGQ